MLKNSSNLAIKRFFPSVLFLSVAVKFQKSPRFYWSMLSMLHGIILHLAAILDLECTALGFCFQMYRQQYSQNYGQPESYSQYHGQYASYNTDSAAPSSYASQPRIVLDEYNSDLNFVIEPDGVTGSSLHKDGFEYMWAGARATHGIRTGKVR